MSSFLPTNQPSEHLQPSKNGKQTPTLAWIIDGDKVLVSCDLNEAQKETDAVCYQQHLQPSSLNLSAIDNSFVPDQTVGDKQISDILYEIDGMVRLTPDERNFYPPSASESKDQDNDTTLPLFAMTKATALKLGLLTVKTVESEPQEDSDNSITSLVNGQFFQQQAVDEYFIDTLGNQHQFISYRNLVSVANPIVADGVSQSIQKLRWQADHKFCSRCASTTVSHSVYPAMVCSSCGYAQYPRVQPCVITAIIRKNPDNHKQQILLAHHHRYGSDKQKPTKESHQSEQQLKQPPQNLRYGLIAGFVEAGETLEHAVHRESLEEVGIRVTNLRYLTSQPWPYPSNLMVGFIADYDTGDIVIQEDELSHAAFFDIDDLPLTPPKGTIAYTLIHHVMTHQPSIG